MDEKPYPESPILIVDDELNFLNSIEVALKIDGITNVECCQKSREVLPRLKKKKYSLILLDLIMPDIRGEELLPKIIEKFPKIPIIVITADKDIEKAVECLRQGEGVIDYLVKPVESDRLLEKVRSGLDYIGKAQSVIDKIYPEIKNKKIDSGNVGLFYALGHAYEKIEEFGKAAGLYRDIKKFNPDYTGIHEKLEKFEKLIKDIIPIYHKERYEKIEEIGKGGIGIVFRAKDTILDRIVALKILNQSPVPGKRDIERFFSEAQKVAKLQHANIVGVYNCGQIENDYFISMEFIEGKDLHTIINDEHPIPITDVLIIAKKLFKALSHSHQHGVIHRDIKPGNIMITYENEVKVVDFGIAALKDDLKTGDRNVVYGTPFYMSPDQYENSNIDHLSDIYSAGVTLFHLVTGKVPFDGTEPLEIIAKHMNEPVPNMKKYRHDIPEKLIKIIEKCMGKKKEKRYKNAAQVIREIDNIRDESGNALITDQTRLKILEPVDLAPFILKGDGPTSKVNLNLENSIRILNDEGISIEERINAVRNLEFPGDPQAIRVLKSMLRNDNKVLAFTAFTVLKNLEKIERSDVVDVLDKIDIPVFTYHLVISRYASPELLINPDLIEIKKALLKFCPSEKGVDILAAVLGIYNDEYSNQNPNPLWHSWITTTQREKIRNVKIKLGDIIIK